MKSVQLAPQIWRSDGQTTSFTGVGLVWEVPGIVVAGDRFSAGRGGGSGEGVSIMICDATTGVAGVEVITGEADEGRILPIPGFVSISKIAIIAITATPARIRIFD